MTRRTSTWPAAVLWDMDGTLVDTEPYWISAEHTLAAEYHATWTDDQAMRLVGSDLNDAGRSIVEQTHIPLTPEQVVERLLDLVAEGMTARIPWRDGALDLLGALRRDRVPCALVTMSYRRLVDPVLAALPQRSFDVVVTGDSVHRGKPHPEPYLSAARLLGVEPGRCLAIEDSGTGAASAEAAGCRVLVVPNHVEVPGGPARRFLDSLTEVDPAGLGNLLGAG